MVINQTELQKILQDKAGHKTQIVTFAAKTIPNMRRKGNLYWGRVDKVNRVNAIIGIWSYQNCVNLQRSREGIEEFFVPIERRWGKRIPRSPFVEYQGQLYLEAKVKQCSFAYYLDGVLPSNDDLLAIQGFITDKNESLRQGVEHPIVLRDYRLDHITHLQCEGDIFEIK